MTYVERYSVCPKCGQVFVWSTDRQRQFDYNTKAGSPANRLPLCRYDCKGARALV